MKMTKEIEDFINLTITEHMGKSYTDWKLKQQTEVEPDEVEEAYKKVIETLTPEQEEALKQLGFELPQPDKARSRTNNRKMVFDSACRVMFLDICKRHGLELDEEPSYGGRQYLEKQDYIRMKQKEEIAEQQETIEQQIDIVNANRLDIAKQRIMVRGNEQKIQEQEEKLVQQEREFKEKFISNSDRIMSQGELIEEQKQELQQLTIRIEDVETLLDEVSSEAYDKAVEKVAREAVLATRKDDIYLAEDSKKWIQSPERKASRKEKEYAVKRLDGLIRKIENAMEKAVGKIVRQLKQPEKKKAVLTRQKDSYRDPYAVYGEDRKRQCIFAGSTNTRQFIPFDRTGARRFLPIAIDSSKAEKHILDDEEEARAYFDQLWAEAMVIYWTTENKNSLLKFSKEMEKEIEEYRKQFTQEDTMAGTIQGWLDAYKGTHVCSVQIWKEAFDHFDREPKKFETNEICSIMDTQITGWKRAGIHRFEKQGYGRQRSWIREGTEDENVNEPDKDGFTKLTKAEQLELPFDLPDREKG